VPTASRKPRSDGKSNRERLIEIAHPILSDPDADSSPVAIARAAGVGVGTLYRHFPTREALAEAAYRKDLAALCESDPRVLPGRSAADALRSWMERCVENSFSKYGMVNALHAAVATGSGADLQWDETSSNADTVSDEALGAQSPSCQSRILLVDAVEVLLAAGADDGTLRTDVSPDDVLVAVTGIVSATHEFGSREQANRLVTLLLDALTAQR
jgi:AcrR family transcriptional regulator